MALELNEILKIALKGGASDIHLKSGLPPMFRVDGALVPLKNGERLMPDEMQKMAFGIMNQVQKRSASRRSARCDLAYGIPGLGRFRVNVFQQRGTVGIVFRVIPFGVKSIEQLHLPKVIEKIAMEQRGLVLVTGTTGSGKSTTLAAMIDHINSQPHLPHHDDRGPDRVPDPRPPLDREPARDRRRHAELRQRAARRAAPGPRRHPRRRDARLRDDRDRAHRGRDRPPRDVHAAHARRHRDDQPHHLGVPALPAEAGAPPARARSSRR